jgi:hypothetical protein
MANTRPKVFTREWFSRAAGMTTRQKRAIGILIVLVFVTVIFVVYLSLTFKNCWSLDLSFEGTPEVEWCYDYDNRNEKVQLVSTATHGSQSVRLGQPGPPATKSSTSRVYHEMVIPQNYGRPMLSFWYQICTNDSIHYSDFRAYLITSTDDIAGTEPITAEVIKRDGYRCCKDQDTAPLAGYKLQWRRASYDLTDLKGRTVILVFETNNLDPDESLGIWTHVDHVEVVDVTLAPTLEPYSSTLPIAMRDYSTCDRLDLTAVCDYPSGSSVLSSAGQPTPTPTSLPTRPPTKVPTPP